MISKTKKNIATRRRGFWFTTKNGQHIYVEEGETPKEACERIYKEKAEEKEVGVDKADQREQERQSVMAFVQGVRNGNQPNKKINIMDVTEKQRTAIKELLGVDIEADKNTLSIYEVYHVEKRHGKNGIADRSMKMLDDYGSIVDTLYDFDTVDFCRRRDGSIDVTRAALYKGNHAPMIKFCKVIDGKFSYVVEAVVDGKTKELKVISSYKTKKQDT